MNGSDPTMNATGMIGIPSAPQMHPALEHNIYGEISPVTNSIPHSMASSMMIGCGLTQTPAMPYNLNAPPHGMSMIPQTIGITDLPPYSH